jgi:hypothetical protein
MFEFSKPQLLSKLRLDESIGLSSLLILSLFNDKIRQTQRDVIIQFLKTSQAKDAADLGLKTHDALCDIALKQYKSGKLVGIADFLQKLKENNSDEK